MSRVPIQKIIAIKKNNAKGNQGNVSISNQVLQSESVKRLLNQPNIILRTVPIKSITNQGTIKKNVILSVKKNGLNQNPSTPNKSQVSFQTVKNSVSLDESRNETLLPSKTNGKSEILIRPIIRKQKPCGHYESCEHLVCDVKFQNYADESGVTPILARTIDEEEEINAPVSRHCANPMCDALSIDHNRCRRASVALYRFDKQSCCDICGVPLKTRKLRANHRGCKRKHVYRHNEADSAEILRKKMRERELQILDSAKLKRKDYLDPINGHNKALEILRKNEELIVIPKNQAAQQAPIVTITTLPTSVHNSSATTKQFTVNNSSGGGNVTQTQLPQIKNVYGNVISSIPIVIGNQQGVLLNTGKQGGPAVNVTSSTGQNVVQNPVITVTTVPGAQGQGNIIRPVILSNWTGNNQSQVLTTSQLQPKPIITPIRVVPIANFKTQPSLLHQVQGMPKFCIMADSTNVQSILQPPPLVRIQTIQTNNNQQTIVLPNIKIAPKKKEEPKIVPKIEKEEVQEVIEPETDSVEIKEEVEDEEDDNLGEGTMLDTIRKRRKKTQHKFLFKTYVNAEKEKIVPVDKKVSKSKNFSCPYCNKKLGTEWYFKTHVARHKGETPYVCKVCEKEFVNSYEMKKHHSSKHTKQEIRCEFCPHVSNSEKNLKTHMTQENEQNPVKCWACDVSAISCEMLDRHQRLSHGSEICRNCGERMSHVRLMKHLILRHGMTKPKAQEEAERLSGTRSYTQPPEPKTDDEEEIEIKQECNGEEFLDDEITIKEEVGDVEDIEYYDYESYNYEEETPQEDADSEMVYETEETEQQATQYENEEENRYISEIQDDDEETQDLNLVLEEEEEGDIESQFEEVFENGDEEMEMEVDEQFGDDASLCNACGKMFANKKKYTEHRAYCANAAGSSDDASNGSDKFTALNGKDT